MGAVVVWCGVVWCVVCDVWCMVCGVAWRGVAWRGVVWCGVVWHDLNSNVFFHPHSLKMLRSLLKATICWVSGCRCLWL